MRERMPWCRVGSSRAAAPGTCRALALVPRTNRSFALVPTCRAIVFALAALLLACPGGGVARAAEDPVTLAAEIRDGKPPVVALTVKIADGLYIHSLTQPPVPLKTIIKVAPPAGVTVGEFVADRPFEAVTEEGQAKEKYKKEVVFTAPLELPAGTDLKTLAIDGSLRYQACRDKACLLPKTLKFSARLGGAPAGAGSAAVGLLPGAALPLPGATSSDAFPSPAPPPPFSRAGVRPAVRPTTGPEALAGAGLGPLLPLPGAELPAAPPPPAAAPVAPPTPQAAPTGAHQAAGSHVKIRGAFVPQTARPGDRVLLQLTLTPDLAAGYHLYGLRPKDESTPGFKPTLLLLDRYGAAVPEPVWADRPFKEVATDLGPVPQYAGAVTYTLPFRLPDDAPAGPLVLSGLLGYQSCSDKNCDRPLAVRFTANLTVDPAAPVNMSPGLLGFASASYTSVNQALIAGNVFNAAAGLQVGAPPAGPTLAPAEVASPAAPDAPSEAAPAVAAAAPVTTTDFLWNVVLAFLGGIVMNFMPCVLPVIGLKLAAFVQQGKDDRLHTFLLNVVYSLGILAVFWALAAVGIAYGLAWGQQFGNAAFKMFLIGAVWLMALSFVGVWEIPIPGFAMSDSAQQMAAKEGVVGAFLKGVVTTLLATPCGAPFMGSALAFSAGKPAPVVFAIFTSIGLGMAAPYLVLGANPQWARYLPRPGAWMNTLKEFLGFVLLFTAVFLCGSLNKVDLTNMLWILVGLWMSCWIIGRIEEDASAFHKWLSRGLALGVTGGILALCFVEGPKLDWQPYSDTKLAELRKGGKTVLIDFTADWCLNCKFVERTALNRDATRKMVAANGVATLIADMTEDQEELNRALARHHSQSIPLTVIYPGNGGPPILLRDIYTQDQLLDALQKAGPSTAPRPEMARK